MGKPLVKFCADDVKLLAEKPLYQGFFKMQQLSFKHRLFAGGWSGNVSREVFERGHAVVVLPYDSERDQVVLIEQLRIPALATAKTPWLLELVAGMIEPGEEPIDVARRELFEETGLSARQITPINSYLTSPGGTTERLYCFWADIDASQAKGLHGLAQEHEDIKLHVVTRQQAYQMVEQGEIDNASTMIGLQWLQLHYQNLRKNVI